MYSHVTLIRHPCTRYFSEPEHSYHSHVTPNRNTGFGLDPCPTCLSPFDRGLFSFYDFFRCALPTGKSCEMWSRNRDSVLTEFSRSLLGIYSATSGVTTLNPSSFDTPNETRVHGSVGSDLVHVIIPVVRYGDVALVIHGNPHRSLN